MGVRARHPARGSQPAPGGRQRRAGARRHPRGPGAVGRQRLAADGAAHPVLRGRRAGLGVWALPSALAFVLWLAVTSSRRRRSVPDDRTTEVPRSLAGDWVAWQVTAFMGLQSLGFYTMLSWLPSVYRSYGMSPEDAGRLLSLMIILGAPIALVVPTMLTRAAQQSGWALGSVLTIASGVLGLLLAPTWHPFLWATVLGIGLGVAFPLALTLVVLRSRDASDAAQLSAMSQSVGYGMAAIGPFVFGLLRDLTAGWTVPVLFLLVVLLPQAIAGVGAGRAAFVGDGGVSARHRRRRPSLKLRRSRIPSAFATHGSPAHRAERGAVAALDRQNLIRIMPTQGGETRSTSPDFTSSHPRAQLMRWCTPHRPPSPPARRWCRCAAKRSPTVIATTTAAACSGCCGGSDHGR